MYLALGAVIFEPLPITAHSERYGYDFAEHAVVEGKPLLQFIGDKLDETTFSIRFHHSFCNPAPAFDELKAAADSHQALRLSSGTGRNYGMRVVTALDKTLVKTMDDGRPLLIEATLTLKEWVDTNPLGTRQAVQRKAAPGLSGRGPIGLVKPAPRQQVIIAAGMAKADAAEMATAAKKTTTLADFMATYYPGQPVPAVATNVKGLAAQIGDMIGPAMVTAQSMAAGVQGAAASLQGQMTAISGLASNITRITSGLPAPLNIVGNRIATLNSAISARATRTITMTSSIQGDAIETATRAQMITRMLPAVN